MSDSNAPYDPNAPEGEVTGRSQYMTRKDLRTMLLGTAVFLLCLYPVYKMMEKNSERARCTANIKAINEAISLYAQEHDGRYPPIARGDVTNQGIVPTLGASGHVYTWASDVQNYMSARASFLCPSAEPDEIVYVEDPRTNAKTLALSYGMYAPYGGYLTTTVENPDQTIIVAETSNGGANSTYDPCPYLTTALGKSGQAVEPPCGQPGGDKLPDGFVIDWSDSNAGPTMRTVNADKSVTPGSKFVTRLAFPGSSNGVFDNKTTQARHGESIHGLTATGERLNLTPEMAAFYSTDGRRLNPAWTVPPNTDR